MKKARTTPRKPFEIRPLQNTLYIMLKEPHAGRVKTRLGRDIGMPAAAWWFRHQSASLIRRLGTDARWTTVAAVSPDAAVNSRSWSSHLIRTTQGRGDLGDRMDRILCNAPSGRALIIGGDIPGITPKHIQSAFSALGQHDAVFGPAPDGGFWLVGFKRGARPIPRTLFKDVRWSTKHALEDSIQSLGPDISIATTDTLRDVDTAADLAALHASRGFSTSR